MLDFVSRRLARQKAGGALRLLFALFAILALTAAALLPPGHDYRDYLSQWQLVLSGDDPWADRGFPVNAYGPLHVALAVLVLIFPAANRVLYTLVWLGLVAWTWRRTGGTGASAGAEGEGDRREGLLWIGLWCLNPFFWVFTVAFGTMDIVIAASCVCALAASNRRRPLPAALALAAGLLLKFIPALLLPFLALPAGFLRGSPRAWLRAVDWRLVSTFALVALFGFGLSYALWGDSVWKPFVLGRDRPSAMLSVFRWLRGSASPLRGFTDEPNMDAFSLPLLLPGYATIVLLYGLGRLERGAASVCALFVVFLFYKVGHHQFYAPLFFLLPLALGARPAGSGRRRAALAYGSLPLVWISAMVGPFLLLRYRNADFRWLDEWQGLPTFIVGLVGLVGFVRASWREDPDLVKNPG